MELPDQQQDIVRRAQQGDRSAFNCLVREYGPRAVNLANLLVKDRELASEIVQQAMFKAFINLPSLKAESAFYPWLAKIIVNLSRNYFRGKGRSALLETDVSQTVTLDETTGKFGSRATDETDQPHTKVQYDELQSAMKQAVDELPDSYRMPLVMFTLNELSHAEIAAALDIPEETIRWRVHQARKMLRSKLKEYM